MFNRIHDKLLGKDPFIPKVDALSKEGITPLVRMILAIQQLSYGEAADRGDEYLQISETISKLGNSKICP
jgi:hypothetical protein